MSVKNFLFWFILLSVVLLSGIVCLYFGFGSEKELAAWIQAGGSVIGILVTGGLVILIQLMNKESSRNSIFAIAEAAYDFSKKVRGTVNASDFEECLINFSLYDEYDKSVADGFVQALSSIPFHEVGSSKAVAALLSMQRQFVFLEQNVEAFINWKQCPHLKEGIAVYKDEKDKLIRISKLKKDSFEIKSNNVLKHLDEIEENFKVIEGNK